MKRKESKENFEEYWTHDIRAIAVDYWSGSFPR